MTPSEAKKHLLSSSTLRVAINYGNPVLAQRDAHDQPAGVSAALARALAQQLEVEIDFVTFPAAGEVTACALQDVWDIAFVAIDPVRAEEIAFTPPYVIIEGTYLVHHGSPIQSIADADAPGNRIAVGKGAAYDLFLTRTLRHASIERAATSSAAVDLFLAERLEAAAGVRQPLEAVAAEHPELRVIPGHFTAIQQAMATPKPKAAALPYLVDFIEHMKASGFVADALRASGRGDASVAPPQS